MSTEEEKKKKVVHKRLASKTTKAALNEQLKKATKQEARVIIAKDALWQIELGNIVPKSGTYAEPVGAAYHQDENLHEEYVIEQAKKGAPVDVTCEACALGALFLTDYWIRNGVVPELNQGIQSGMRDRLSQFFSREQLSLMEDYFESEFADSDEESLRDILECIIKNKGTFIPPDDWLADQGITHEDLVYYAAGE